MSKENAIRFLEKARDNESVKEALKSVKTPEDKKEAAKLLADIAARNGEDIAAEDLAQALEEMEAAARSRTDSAASDIEALEDEDLKNVAGGGCDWLWFCSKDWMTIQTVG